MSFFKKLFGKGKENHKAANEVEQNEIGMDQEALGEEQSNSIQHDAQLSKEEEQHDEDEVKASNEETNDSDGKMQLFEQEDSIQAEKQAKEEALDASKVSEEADPAILEVDEEEADETLDFNVSQEVEESSDEMVQDELEVSLDEDDASSDSAHAEEEMMNLEEEVPHKKQGFIKRLFSGLAKTRDHILKGVDDVLSNFKSIDEDLYEELEEALIMADFGVDTTLLIMDRLRKKVKEEKITDPSLLKGALQEIIRDMLMGQPDTGLLNENGPTVILVIGVNGVGKTTSIGKMAHSFKGQGKKVLIAAADTFRAAAIEQLQVWSERAGADIIKHDEGSDAAAVVFDAIAAAKSRKVDVLICDTAGRLQNKTNLMRELEKISRIIEREYPEAKKEILIALDATTGQNAIQQVKLFKEVAAISGIILTKLDGTAKGGAIVGIYENLQVPVKYIGVGEKIDDLQPFDAQSFADALFQMN